MTNEEVKNLFKEQERQVVEGIDLVDEVRIRRIAKEDFEDLKSRFFPLPANLRELISPNTFVLVKHITAEERHDFQPDQTMRNTVLALRLLKRGYVYGSYVLYVLLPEKRSRILTSSSWDEQPREERLGFRYALNFDEIPELKKLLEKIQSLNFSKRKRLHLACKRFQRAYEENDAEDQLIDLMIAFEALFIRKEIPGDFFKEKIANGCSDLLGKNDKERQEIKRLLTKAYSIRSHIVHGAEYKKEYDMYEFVLKIEDYLRKSIKKLLD